MSLANFPAVSWKAFTSVNLASLVLCGEPDETEAVFVFFGALKSVTSNESSLCIALILCFAVARSESLALLSFFSFAHSVFNSENLAFFAARRKPREARE